MLKTLAAIGALLASIALLLAGNSLQGTLLGVRATTEGFPTEATGLVMSAYFAGFVAGSWYGPRLILAVGHIRVFAGLASIASGVVLVHILLVSPVTWGLLRVITGFCFAGLYIIIESWLNDRADNTTRGQVISLYMVTNFTALAIGPLLLNIADPQSFELFIIVSLLVSLSLVPVTLIPSPTPRVPEMSTLSLPQLIRISPLGVAGATLTGVAFGGFWGMAPVYGTDIGMDAVSISLLMSVGVIGSVAAQYPLGFLSDRADRRVVIAAASFVAAGLSVTVGLVSGQSVVWVLAAVLVFGAVGLPLYSISMAHANDFAQPRDMIQMSAGLLLMNGLGATAGPFLASILMGIWGASALFYQIAVVLLALGGFAVWRITRRAAPAAEDKTAFHMVPHGTATMDLDQRVAAAQQEVAPEPQTAPEDAGTR